MVLALPYMYMKFDRPKTDNTIQLSISNLIPILIQFVQISNLHFILIYFKVLEDETYVFTSSLLSLLAEFGTRPPLFDASCLSNFTKVQIVLIVILAYGRLYNQLHWKLRDYHVPDANDQQHGQYSHYVNVELGPDPRGYGNRGVRDPSEPKVDLFTGNKNKAIFRHLVDTYYIFLGFQFWLSGFNYRDVEGPTAFSAFGDAASDTADAKLAVNDFLFPLQHAEGSEDLPGIYSFQITGDAKPGGTLRACGFPINRTTVCIFQWVRLLQDGVSQYIEGATNPDYVVTADDVDKIIAVECTPMDDSGRQVST
ncbi:unnamed protein product [Spirodela intermedia]|uniref:AIR9-like A9 domain-containing protein n=1 Tax=Spirodela intermedia TaxID=51605 RepID=A0A7I8JIS1_SPIIN|nr:unnamed protein product [Spirodela intermedia]CAA6669665.1 unnamed protein product [Spirodela intermedia]